MLSMMRFVLLLFFGVYFNASFGQGNIRPYFELGIGHLEARRFDKAVNTFDVILNGISDKDLQRSAYYYRAKAQTGLGNFPAAVSDFTASMNIDSSDLGLFLERGQVYLYMNELEKARRDFAKVYAADSLNDNGQQALFFLASIAYSQEKYQEAINLTNRLMQMQPANPELFFARASARMMMDDLGGAIADFNRAIELKPDYREAYANRGVAKINQLSASGRSSFSEAETSSACQDFLTAKKLGDTMVDELISMYCTEK